MAGPAFRVAAALAVSASAASILPVLPTVDAGGHGVLLAVVASKNNDAHSTATSGWTLVNQTNSGAGFTASLWKAAQGAAAPVFTWASAAACSAQVAYYSAPQDVMDVAGVALLGAVGTGSVNPHATGGDVTTTNNVDALYIDACAANTLLAIPSGWTQTSADGSNTSGTAHAFGQKAVATSGTSSGATSTNGGAAAWVQFQIQLSGIAPDPGLEVSKAELGAWLLGATANGLAVAKVEAGAWAELSDFRAAKMELGAWMEAPIAGGRRMSLM